MDSINLRRRERPDVIRVTEEKVKDADDNQQDP